MRASRIAVIVGPCLLLAACSSVTSGGSTPVVDKSARPPSTAVTTLPVVATALGGIGSTVTTMAEVHGAVVTPSGPCATRGSCFGNPVAGSAGVSTPTFTGVIAVNDLVGGYEQHVPPGSTAAQAVAQVLRFLPSDARASPITTISGAMASCAYVNVSSPTLAALFPEDQPAGQFASSPGAVLGVELSTTTAQGFTVYEPGNVGQADVKLGADDSTMAC